MRSRFRLRLSNAMVPVGASLLCGVLLSGCNPTAIIAGSAALRAARNAATVPGRRVPYSYYGMGYGVTAQDTAYVNSLKPLHNGPGLLVCEPVTTGTDANISAFGAGCGRWLHLTVSGQPEFDRSPLWDAVDRARREAHQHDHRLTPQQAAAVAAGLGVTHLATGQLTGNAGRVTLTYQMWTVAGPQRVGQPVSVTGTAAAIVAQLPAMAHQMAQRLGAKSITVPAQVGATPSDLSFLGRIDWTCASGYPSLSAADTNALRALAMRLPLAGVLWERSGTCRSDAAWAPAVTCILTQQPPNPVAIADVAALGARMLAPYRGTIQKLARQHPDNYPLASAEVCWYRIQIQRAFEQRAAEHAVRCNVANPYAWLELAATYSNEAEDRRQSRAQADLSQNDSRVLQGYYSKWEAVAEAATQADPNDSYAWSEVARAASFATDPRTADQALWMALRLDKSNGQAYAWGMQMYQDKWYGDRAKLRQVAQMALANAGSFAPNKLLLEGFRYGPLPVQGEAYMKKVLARDPTNAPTLYELGAMYLYQRHYLKAGEPLLRRAYAADPNDPHIVEAIADLDIYKRDKAGTERMYRRATALDPTDGYAHAGLASALHDLGRQPEAIAEARQALRLGYNNPRHPVWQKTGGQAVLIFAG